MATLSANQKTLLRNKLNLTEETLSDEDIAPYETQANLEYSAYSATVLYYAVGLDLAEELWMKATAQVDYQLNEESQKLSQRAKALESIVKYYSDKLDKAVEGELGAGIRHVKYKRRPTRKQSYPDS